jgi:hypothetical protein
MRLPLVWSFRSGFEERIRSGSWEASIATIGFGLNGFPRSLRWPCLASAAEMARRLSLPPFGFLRASAFANLTTSGRLTVALAPLNLLARRHALAPPRRRQLGDECSLLELGDRAEHLADEDRGRGVFNEVRRR